MKIGIIGSGNIGGTLGRHWAHVGHEVMFSSRNPDDLKSLALSSGAKTGNIEAAAAFGDVILLAIPFGKVKRSGSAGWTTRSQNSHRCHESLSSTGR